MANVIFETFRNRKREQKWYSKLFEIEKESKKHDGDSDIQIFSK